MSYTSFALIACFTKFCLESTPELIELLGIGEVLTLQKQMGYMMVDICWKKTQNLYFYVHIAGRTVLRSVFICPKTIIEPVSEQKFAPSQCDKFFLGGRGAVEQCLTQSTIK